MTRVGSVCTVNGVFFGTDGARGDGTGLASSAKILFGAVGGGGMRNIS